MTSCIDGGADTEDFHARENKSAALWIELTAVARAWTA